ncbi:unnamed protein product [Scytosiphon promiscuus]
MPFSPHSLSCQTSKMAQQLPLPGQQTYYPSGVPALQPGMPGTPGAMNMGTPGAIMPNGQVVANPPMYAPSPGAGGIAPGSAPVITREQQQFVGVPPGMTRESMQPGYDPRLKQQRRVFNPKFSFKDSFGRSRNNRCKCCTVS